MRALIMGSLSICLWLNSVYATTLTLTPGQVLFQPAEVAQAYQSGQMLWSRHPNGQQLRKSLQRTLSFLAYADIDPKFQYWMSALEPESDLASQEVMLTDALFGILLYIEAGRMASIEQKIHLNFTPVLTTTDTILSPAKLTALVDQIDLKIPGQDEMLKLMQQQSEQIEQPWSYIRFPRALHPDERQSGVEELRHRLQQFYGLALTDGQDIYNSDLEYLVRRFQRQHGLTADAVIGNETLYWLNISPIRRRSMVARNALRQSLVMHEIGERFILVNIPQFEMTMHDRGGRVMTSKVIVGRDERPTPLISSNINRVVLNPWWYVPYSIATEDLLPAIARDTNYLKAHHYKVHDASGQSVDASTVDWNRLSTEYFPYTIRQEPGRHNALGRYKFHFPNSHAVYLHDTAAPGLFRRDQRDLSSGCIRVAKADALAHYLLRQDLVRTKRTHTRQLNQPMPVHLAYWTSWHEDGAGLQFRNDIYDFDRDLGLRFK